MKKIKDFLFGSLLAAVLVVAGLAGASTVVDDTKTGIPSGGGGAGTVSSVGITGSNGIGVTSSPITTTGTMTLSLGAITPTTVSTGTVTAAKLLTTAAASGSPAYSFVGSPTYGLNSVGGSTILVAGAKNVMSVTGSAAGLPSNFALGFNSTVDNSDASAVDTALNRDAADTFAQRRGTNAQAFRVYNTYTDASNYERGFIGYTSNELRIGHEAAGTGNERSLGFYRGTTRYANFALSAIEWTAGYQHYFKGAILSAYKNDLFARTADLALDLANYGSAVFTNTGAAGEVILTLPSAASSVGLSFEFNVTAAQYIRVKADTGGTVRNAGSVSASGGYIRANTIGNSLTVRCIATNTWVVTSAIGTWTIDS